jgi:hypothetical protein
MGTCTAFFCCHTTASRHADDALRARDGPLPSTASFIVTNKEVAVNRATLFILLVTPRTPSTGLYSAKDAFIPIRHKHAGVALRHGRPQGWRESHAIHGQGCTHKHVCSLLLPVECYSFAATTGLEGAWRRAVKQPRVIVTMNPSQASAQCWRLATVGPCPPGAQSQF